MDRTTE